MLHHFLKVLESNPIQLYKVTPLYSVGLQDLHTVQNNFLIIDVICYMKYATEDIHWYIYIVYQRLFCICLKSSDDIWCCLKHRYCL